MVIVVVYYYIEYDSFTPKLASGGHPNSKNDLKTVAGRCCNESASLSVEKILEVSGQCSNVVKFQSVVCDCESLIACKLVVMSGISNNHFVEATDLIASVQTHMPGTPVIMYDLGLNNENKEKLTSYCGVQVKSFNFSKYPQYVRNLSLYAWKPLIINDAYEEKEYEVILWCDASCRLLHSLKPLFRQFSSFPMIPALLDDYSFISTTHNDTLKYLHLNDTRQKYATIGKAILAGLTLYWFTQRLQEVFLKFWVDCALHKECIAPKTAQVRPCNWPPVDVGEYVCHRFDQSAFNGILTREFGIEWMKQFSANIASSRYFAVERYPTKRYKVKSEENCF